MKPICMIGRGGLKPLIRAFQARNVEAIISQTRQPGYFNVGWGWSGGDVNRHIPPNKLWELQQMQQARLRIVPLVETYEDAMKLWRAGKTLYQRNTNHQCGTDVKLVGKDIGLPVEHHYGFWTVAVPRRKEFRVHVWNGTAFRSGIKINKETGQPNKPDGVPVWNEETGWVLSYGREVPTEAKRLAEKATKACVLDFSGVDIIESVDGDFYLLETNTAPGLGPETAAAYAEQIITAAKER